MTSSEADARIVIDELLRQAQWDPTDKSQVRTEVTVQDLEEKGRSSRSSATASNTVYRVDTKDGGKRRGRADYVLFTQNGRPLAVIEAKKRAFEPYQAKQQALPYAQRIGAPFIFLTNGELIYFWDYQNDDAHVVSSNTRNETWSVWLKCARRGSHSLPLSFLSTMFGKEKLGLFALINGKRCKHLTKRLSWESADF